MHRFASCVISTSNRFNSLNATMFRLTPRSYHRTFIQSESKYAKFITKHRAFINSSFADMSCHTASLCSFAAYLSTDILALRTMAVISGLLAANFQYYKKPEPLWISLKWNALLTGVNVFMIGNLLYDQYQAENMPAEMAKIYESGCFDERGFSKVQFMEFWNLGRPRVFPSGSEICRDGREMNKLFYIVKGSADVTNSKDNRKLATITPHNFIGEMAFLVYHQSLKKDDAAVFAKASANVRGNGLVHAREWDAEELASVLETDRELANAFASYCSHDLRRKLLQANEEGSIMTGSDKGGKGRKAFLCNNSG